MSRTQQILGVKPLEMQEKVRNAPLLPGCYLYKDGRGSVLYVGKAKVLRNRVKSYFTNYDRVEEKIRVMISKAKRVDFVITDSEIEALILESVLIKKYRPKYNTMMVDDKNYAYVRFDKIKATKPGVPVNMPTIKVTRQKYDDGAEYFGPYPDTRAVKRLVRRLRRIYPYCTTKRQVEIPGDKDLPFKANNPKACFHFQIEQCNGICFGVATRRQLEENFNNIKKFFKGEKSALQTSLEKQMKAAAKEYSYESAIKFRNMLFDIKYVGSNLHVDADIDEVAITMQKKKKQARSQAELIEKLDFPTDIVKDRDDFRIECYDISNIQGTNAVGSMVVFVGGIPRPDLYRRFRIRMKNEPNDFAMLQEVLTRRFNQYLRSYMQELTETKNSENQIYEYTDNEGFTIEIPKEYRSRIKQWKSDDSFAQKPDLMIIDGGKGQLSSTYKILRKYQLDGIIPLVGLAKREEEIFKMSDQFAEHNSWDQVLETNQDEFKKVRLPKRSESLYLVQRIRDEAHRFAITYHRRLRAKQLKI
jgi:excinuclease ABC subunit C